MFCIITGVQTDRKWKRKPISADIMREVPAFKERMECDTRSALRQIQAMFREFIAGYKAKDNSSKTKIYRDFIGSINA